jgi:hypothetical protein
MAELYVPPAAAAMKPSLGTERIDALLDALTAWDRFDL